MRKIGSICNPEYEVDISKGLPRIADYGNIQIDNTSSAPTMKDLLNKLKQKVILCIKRGNIPFVFGGSRDLFGAVAEALLQAKPEARNCFISVNHRVDLENLENEVPSQTSNKRYLLERMNP